MNEIAIMSSIKIVLVVVMLIILFVVGCLVKMQYEQSV